MIGRYELVRRLGRGASGEVWEAVLLGPHGFRKPVALKRLRGGLEGEALAALFREARLGALLQHPNLVATYALEEVDGAWQIAMELVRGPSAGELLRAGPLSGARVVDLGAQVCAALAYAHGIVADGLPNGLVHRD